MAVNLRLSIAHRDIACEIHHFDLFIKMMLLISFFFPVIIGNGHVRKAAHRAELATLNASLLGKLLEFGNYSIPSLKGKNVPSFLKMRRTNNFKKKPKCDRYARKSVVQQKEQEPK